MTGTFLSFARCAAAVTALAMVPVATKDRSLPIAPATTDAVSALDSDQRDAERVVVAQSCGRKCR